MGTLVWVEAWEVQSFAGEPFSVGQHVTWPVSSDLARERLARVVGATTAARVQWIVEWHAPDTSRTVELTGRVEKVHAFLSGLAAGETVPGSVESCAVTDVDGWETEREGLHLDGYLVTLADPGDS